MQVALTTRRVTLLLTLLVFVSPWPPVAAEEAERPWRLDSGLKLPRWLHLEFTQRTRFESLQNQFRPVDSEDDRALALRTTLLTEFRFERVAAGFELADSRIYLEDSDAPLDTTLINPLDFLQAYVHVTVPDAFAEGADLQLRAGRQTIDLGGRRLLARNRFRNTINAFSGVSVQWVGPRQDVARAFVTVPVQRRPTLLEALAGNDMEPDSELSSSIFWGLFYGSRPRADALRGEAYVLGLHESDDDVPTSDRDFVTPGFRIVRPAVPGRFDFEVEAAFQTGSSRLTPLPEDTTDLSHRAFFVHGEVGRTFAGAWLPRLVLQYDYASGDHDPGDEDNQRFDTLFGARRFEFGPTGIYGAFARSNISSPSIRLELRPHRRVFSILAYRPAWLAQARDLWTTTLIWDPSGNSGTFLGHQIEGAASWDVLPGNVQLEGGFAYLRLGEFPKHAPNGDPDAGDPVYAYAQVVFQF